MKRKSIFIIIIFILTIAAILFFLLRPRSAGTLVFSDIAMDNTQSIDILRSSKGFNFFSGTAIANTDLTKLPPYKSSVVTQNLPLFEVSALDFNPETSTLLAQVVHTREDLYQIDGIQKPSGEPIQVWFTQQGNNTPKLFNPLGDSHIIDARWAGNSVVFLTSSGAGSSLYIFDGSARLLSKDVPYQQIVGTTKNQVVVRETNGKSAVYSIDGTENWRIDTSQTDELFTDYSTNSVIVKNSKNQVQLLTKDSQKILKTSHPYIFVSNGFVFGVDRLVAPTRMGITKLENNEHQDYDLDTTNEAATNESIAGLFMIDISTPKIGIVTDNDVLLIASTNANEIHSIKPLGFPVFKNDSLVSYDPSTNTASIFSDNPARSIEDLAKDCECDVNQFKKQWVVNEDNVYIKQPLSPDEEYEEDF